MSVNRENVIWQSANGTWNRGFFDFYETGDSSDEDFDYEWDVEYDNSVFNWVSTGHATETAAEAAWHGANPGGYTVYAYSKDNAAESVEYDAMAAKLQAEQRERRAAQPVSRSAWGW